MVSTRLESCWPKPKLGHPLRGVHLRATDDLPPSFGEAFRLSGTECEARFKTASDELREVMERDASRLTELVLKQPPLDLLAYLWSLLQVAPTVAPDDDAESDEPQKAVATNRAR